MEHEKILFCAVKTRSEAEDILQYDILQYQFPYTQGIIGEGMYFFGDRKEVRHFELIFNLHNLLLISF